MQLKNKTAVVYGAGGAVGAAVATAFAREGATVFLAGRNLVSLEATAKRVIDDGGSVVVAQVDALDAKSVEDHMAMLIKVSEKIDISFNAITPLPQPGIQGIPIAQLSVESFVAPIASYLKSHFLTARAAARRMAERRSGVILMHTPEPARLGAPLVGGMGPAWAAMESFNRNLSAEFGASGVRAVCIRSTGLPETKTIETVFGLHASAMGITPEQFRAFIEGMTHTKRSVRLAEVANAAVFAASDNASSMTGTVINLTGGIIVD